MKVRTIIGAQYAYAVIESPGRCLDVRLEPGRSAAVSLRQSAEELREKARRILQQAETMCEAADFLESKK